MPLVPYILFGFEQVLEIHLDPPITFVASANCGRYCGDVDFVDIDSATGLMCIEALSGKLAQAERMDAFPSAGASSPCGTSCNMEAIGA